MFPDFLYRLTPRDEQVTPLDIVTFRSGVSSNATTVNSGAYTVPLGRVLKVNSMSLEQDCNQAATDVVEGRVDMYLDSSVPIVLMCSQSSSTEPNYHLNQAFQNDLFIPEGWSMRGIGGFTVADADNQVIFTMSGILIPRGNFAI